jgi:hypothetical protein
MGHNTYSAYTDIFPWFLGGIGLEDPGVGSAAWASGSTEMMRCHASHNAICAEAVPFTWMPLFDEFERAVLPMFYSVVCWCYPLACDMCVGTRSVGAGTRGVPLLHGRRWMRGELYVT